MATMVAIQACSQLRAPVGTTRLYAPVQDEFQSIIAASSSAVLSAPAGIPTHRRVLGCMGFQLPAERWTADEAQPGSPCRQGSLGVKMGGWPVGRQPATLSASLDSADTTVHWWPTCR
jgi:hypothetical protein